MITSKANPLFKRVRAALEEHADEIVIEGEKAIDDAIAAGWKPIARPDFSPELLKSLHTTAVAIFERPRLNIDETKLLVALDGVQDHGNVGTIVRLAAAFDAGGVILLPGCADAYGPKAIRASAGAILTVPIAEMGVDELLQRTPIYAADARGSSDVPRGVVVFGSEGQGVSREIKNRAKLVRVEMSARVESLNVAAAAAILLWRNFHGR